MSILQQINDLKTNFIEDTGRDPKYILLGPTEYMTLLRELSGSAPYNPPPQDLMVVGGLKVRVMPTDYLKVLGDAI